MMLACNPPRRSPDSVWKDVYGVLNGAIVLLRTVTGSHRPSEVVPEVIAFEEGD